MILGGAIDPTMVDFLLVFAEDVDGQWMGQTSAVSQL